MPGRALGPEGGGRDRAMTAVVVIFVIVYLGMMFGSVPGLKLDRSAIALIGAIALLAMGSISRQEAGASIDFSTIGLVLLYRRVGTTEGFAEFLPGL